MLDTTFEPRASFDAGHEIVLTSQSYFGSASSVVNCGARPVFADVIRDSRNVAGESIRAALAPYPAARVPWPAQRFVHTWYKFYGFVVPERLREGWNSDRIVAQMNTQGVPCLHGSCPETYREKAFEGTGFAPAVRLPIARELGETSFMMLVHPTLSDASIAKAVEALHATFDEASR